MDRTKAIAALKQIVQRDVRYLCRRTDLQWNSAIVQTLRELRMTGMRSVFFGGTLRSLLISRLARGHFGRPRDLDIVVGGTSLEKLRARFGQHVSRETRFGGLQLLRSDWHFDVWPLQKTWAFIEDGHHNPTFEDLPGTTFFNLEAIAVEVWPSPGSPRVVFSGDDQFFDGILSRTLEINRVANPFPALSVVRALSLASAAGLSIGQRLARYIADKGSRLTGNEIVDVQMKHYGRPRIVPVVARLWIDHICKHVDTGSNEPVDLAQSVQPTLWQKQPRRLWPNLDRLLAMCPEAN